MNTKKVMITVHKGSALHTQLTGQIIKNLQKAEVAELLADLMLELQNVDQNAPDAELNATSILDSDGRRIELVNGPTATRTIIKE